MEQCDFAFCVADEKTVFLCDQETIGRDGIRIPEAWVFLTVADKSRCRAFVVGAIGGADNGNTAGVFPKTVTRGETADDFVRARYGLGVDHYDTGMEVPVVDHLPRTVRISGPEMVVSYPAAVDVFPSGVEDPAVGKGPGGVVMLDIT